MRTFDRRVDDAFDAIVAAVLVREVKAIREHRAEMHQPCCVVHDDGIRSRCDVDTLLDYIDAVATPAEPERITL